MYRNHSFDEIRIKGLKIFANHGVYEEETKNGQFFYVNAVLYTQTNHAAVEDDLTLSTHYGEVCMMIDRWMKENTCKLLETVAEKLALEILHTYPLVHAIDLEIEKPNAPIPLPFDNVSVKIHRGWHKAYIALGSNLGDKKAYIENAISAMREYKEIEVKKVSTLIETAPYGGVEQDSFLNGVMEIDTLLNPEELLDALHIIERAAHRTREIHWGPRTLDLDILFYDDLVYHSDDLDIPHVDMKNRDFVLGPMAEIAPNFIHPVYRKTVKEMLDELKSR